MAKTSIDARRHIREWGQFFADGKAVTEALVDEFIKRHKKNRFLKQSLQRLINKGLVAKKSGKFIPSLRGRWLFRRLIPTNQKFPPSSWDGKWYLISFDIPISLNSKRDRLRDFLKGYNFYRLQKSVWVGPNQLSSDLWEYIVRNDLDKYCKAMIVEVIEGDEELKRYFKLHK